MQISALQLVGSCIRTSCPLHIFLEFGRGNSRIILELTAEKAQIVISAYLGNVRYGVFLPFEQITGVIHFQLYNVFNVRYAEFFINSFFIYDSLTPHISAS